MPAVLWPTGALIGDPMLLRRWISFLAIVGVLLHAGALARHHVVMLDAHLQHQALITDLLQICHSNGLGTVTPDGLPDIPRPSETQDNCPICSGLASAVALAAPETASWLRLVEKPALETLTVAIFVGQSPAERPPVRGPPHLA
jgi:hypothetical protein